MEAIHRDEAIDILCKFPDQALEACVKPRLQAIKGRPNSEVLDEWLGIIDDCVFAAWTSDFMIRSLHVIWLEIGGTEEFLNQRNQMLREELTSEQKRSLQDRFKWQCRDLTRG